MSKQKSKKLTFWSKYKMPIIAIVAFSAIAYVIIYFVNAYRLNTASHNILKKSGLLDR